MATLHARLTSKQITGIVLAGGRGSRLDGQDKGLLPWRGQPLIANAIKVLQPLTSQLLISCNRHIETYARYGTPVTDQITGYAGPLAGLQAAMVRVQTPYCLAIPCDLPLLTSTSLEMLIEGTDDAQRVRFLRSDDHSHSLCALVRTDCIDSLNSYLNTGRRSVRGWYESVDAVPIDAETRADELFNLNRPQDWARLNQLE